ncbi:DUF1828 domain-containing protein [Levilactobacillus tujiorum]|uniref:DUF1828 domain-containing protein n=1 Tax=Levilactobacillus tujiorum TaxID=2912243 RepID=UPI0014567657|nr:DUF1828 domain-containing protein [Levilactobacillus tujiorum]NLR33181.1 DUF1828 domain-containing protein [Levilactobacillus tujiorum]
MLLSDADIQNIASNWINWITKETHFKTLSNNNIQISLPFTDSSGDGIIFNVEPKENGFLVTDQGYTIWNLEVNGVNVTKKDSNRWRILQSIINPYKFQINQKNEISKIVTESELSQTITDFAQIIINVSDIAFMNRSNTSGMFFDDVHTYFSNKRSEYSFLKNFYADGKTNQKYRFEYLFTPRPNDFKLTKLYNTLSKNSMDAVIGIWSDTQQFREENYGSNATFNLLLNGISEKEKPYVEGLMSHDIQVIDFQDKSSVKEKLAIS